MNILINGPGRSGTTLLSSLISYQKDLAWISGWVNRQPKYPKLAVFNFLYRKEIMNIDFSKLKKMPKPTEAYGFWKYYIKNFNSDHQPSKMEITKIQKAINILVKIQNKEHFITKITGDLRKNIFDEIFTDYKIIWIERDPRVVVSSFMKQRWFYRDRTDDFEKLTMEEKIRFYSHYYLDIYKKSKTVTREVVFYEDLCNNPLLFFERLLSHLGLEFTEEHKEKIKSQKIKSVGWSYYKEKYTHNEKQLLTELLRLPLEDYNYI